MGKEITFDDVVLYAESFGDRGDPTILLIMGAASSSIWWEDEFCEMLARRGFFVIRYDNRDTGKSTSYPPGHPEYTFEDLADDAIRVLDHYYISTAVLMGMSMGGMLAQMAAVRHPHRVLGIVLLASMYFGKGADELPGWDDDVDEFFKTFGSVEPKTDIDTISYAMSQWQVTNKSSRPKNIDRIRNLLWIDLERAKNYGSRVNHSFAHVTGDDLEHTGEIDVPALIIHGTEDAVIPYVHGEMLAKTIANARLITLEGAGHELHPFDYDTVVNAIVDRFLFWR